MQTTQKFFPYGTQYHRSPTPLPDEWEPDLSEIAVAGYTHVQFRPQWRCHERIRGSYVWDDLDALFNLAEKYRLRVVLKPMLETAPDWVFEDLGGQRIGFRGLPISPTAHGAYYVGGWLPCFDNPLVSSASANFIRKLVERYKNHPALWIYDAWNEPVSRPLGQCQCKHSVESYRRWLSEKYITVERLNGFLGKSWTSFDTIRPPASADDYAEMFIWRQWAAYAVAEQVSIVANAIKETDSHAFVMVHVGGSGIIQDTACNTSDDILNAATTDRYGTSLWVPMHPSTPLEHAAIDYQSDWLRRVDPQYWCHEYYPNRADWCRPPERAALSRMIWMTIAGGAGGFTYWQFRSERVGCETNGYGLREINGAPTERSVVADDIASILQKQGSRLVGTRRSPSGIGILFDRNCDLLSRIELMSGHDPVSEVERIDYPYKKALKSAHALYLMSGETVDMVTPGDDLDRIELLHVTALEIVEPETADWLRDFVRNGGNLIIEFPFACRDGATWVSPVRPNNGLDDLLGGMETSRIVAGEGVGAEFFNGCRIGAGLWRVALAPGTGEVIAKWSNGEAAALKNFYGKGRVYSLGASISLAFGDNWDDPSLMLMQSILAEVGLTPSLDANKGIWVRRRIDEDGEIWFVFNVRNSAGEIHLPALPEEIWQGSNCMLEGRKLTLQAGSTWVAAMPASER